MSLRNLQFGDYKDFTVGNILDILIQQNNIEENKNGNETQYATDEKSVDKIMGF